MKHTILDMESLSKTDLFELKTELAKGKLSPENEALLQNLHEILELMPDSDSTYRLTKVANSYNFLISESDVSHEELVSIINDCNETGDYMQLHKFAFFHVKRVCEERLENIRGQNDKIIEEGLKEIINECTDKIIAAHKPSTNRKSMYVAFPNVPGNEVPQWLEYVDRYTFETGLGWKEAIEHLLEDKNDNEQEKASKNISSLKNDFGERLAGV